MKTTTRHYTSPLRAERARETRERILEAVADWMRLEGQGELTLDEVARRAGVERRTIFRHFATKESLLETFWAWINERVASPTLPGSLEELVAGPRETFARFDDFEGVIRSSLHSPTGRAMRLAAVPARRQAFHAALQEATRGADAADRRRLEAVVHCLYSAAAWETLRDYADVTGAQAGDAASWAIGVLVDAVRARERSTDDPS
ncbi:MAG TPA: TetR/AcrR family transcriptional regulator [Thermoanaerobaculia bacterium]|nr:TetR/AcrR family transcriptional regulator [Thermoanaerobaculia bacterium]